MPYPQAKPDDPVYLKNFDPKTFYPALSARESWQPRTDSTSIYPSSSISQQSLPRAETPAYIRSTREIEAQLPPEKRRWSRTRLWIITFATFVAVTIIVLIFAWLGAHNFFRDQKVVFP